MFIIKQLLYIDNLSLVMIGLVGFITICVVSFSARYLKGDRKQGSFYVNTAAIVISVFIIVSANNILLMFVSWTISNIFLVRLMLHKKEWEAARQSSILAFKNFGLGITFLGAAFIIIYKATGQVSITEINSSLINSTELIISSILILLAAMTQSSLWPFHRWLISSLNTPTPVSAIMHAGLVSVGGFLLARFAPMISAHPANLNIIFTLGIITALFGNLYKLIQSDIKRMLACSTMGQMGFMIAQCGLGLFPAAVAHLCWHGLFKAYLFLTAGSAAQEKRLDLGYPPSVTQLLISLICGLVGAYLFSLASNSNIMAGDTTLFLIIIAIITGTQFALPIIRGSASLKLPLALITTSIMGYIYGLSISVIDKALSPIDIQKPQPLNMLHIIFIIVLVAAWLGILFARHPKKKTLPAWMLKIYVRILNDSQPHPKTITTYHNHYRF